jgi:hypothetical protein
MGDHGLRDLEDRCSETRVEQYKYVELPDVIHSADLTLEQYDAFDGLVREYEDVIQRIDDGTW